MLSIVSFSKCMLCGLPWSASLYVVLYYILSRQNPQPHPVSFGSSEKNGWCSTHHSLASWTVFSKDKIHRDERQKVVLSVRSYLWVYRIKWWVQVMLMLVSGKWHQYLDIVTRVEHCFDVLGMNKWSATKCSGCCWSLAVTAMK